MAVTITTIQPQDSLASSRLTLNSNFSALKAGIDAVQLLLDPMTSILSGVKSVTINDNAVPFSTSIFQVGKGSSLLGNVIMGTTGASTSVLINGNGGSTIDQSSLTLNNGNFTMSGVNSVATFNGNLSVAKEFRMPGVANAFSSVVGLTQTTTLNVTDKKYVVLRNDDITGPVTALLPAGTQGQVLEIFHLLGASGFPVYIDALNFAGLTASIWMTMSNDTLRCIFDGASWYLFNYAPASYAGATGATDSSVRFFTV